GCDDIISVERKGIEHRSERLITHGPALGPGLRAPCSREHAHASVLEQSIADRDPRPDGLEPAVRCPAVQIPFTVRIVAEHHDATPQHPFSEQREIADAERVRWRLGLTAQKEQQNPITLEIGAGEVGIEAAVLDRIALVVPRAGRAVQQDGVRQREVEEQQATGLGLTGGEEQQSGQADGRTGGPYGGHEAAYRSADRLTTRPRHSGADSATSLANRGLELMASTSGARR